MKLKGTVSLILSAVMATGAFSALNINTFAAEENYTYYNFAAGTVEGAVNLNDGSVPIYSAEKGYGFVAETSAMPARTLDTGKITWNDAGFVLTEDGTGTYIHNTNSNNYNYGGLVFRTDVEGAGAYRLTVELAGGADSSNTSVAPSGMQASRITSSSYWDSAKKVPVQHYAKWVDATTWTYDYVTGEPYIEFEIEPSVLPTTAAPKTVGVKGIKVEKLENNTKAEGELSTVYVLGDSTEKTYTFEEAGMSGWGQLIYKMFDLNSVNIINYSMGGRSMKAMFTENRFNDVLLTCKPGDYIMIHSAHNDESTGDSAGPEARFGRGSTEAYYRRWLNDIYIPAILSRGAVPVLVTAMPRTSGGTYTRDFSPNAPALMREAAAANSSVELVELYDNAKSYIDEVGTAQTNAIYMSIEAGESPGKTNSGSYANGHPDGKIDGTHYKEAAGKVWCKIIAEDINKQAESGTDNMKRLASYLKQDVKDACGDGNWNRVFPEWSNDVTYAKSGDGTAENDPTYYRNQIEKMLQLGVMFTDSENNFNPLEGMNTNDFISALCALWQLDLNDASINAVFEPYFETGILTREKMAAIILDAYVLRFGKNADGTYNKPAYMTNYNGSTVSPDDPTYDPNLTGKEAQYYPLVGWGNLTDKTSISLEYAEDVYDVYNLGLMRSEKGIKRGSMVNGTEFEPKAQVTRAKAAKELWFLWVLGQTNVLEENQITQITTDGSVYSDVAYVPVSYTAPAYEFSSVNIDSSGALSVELKTDRTGTGDVLTAVVYNADGTVKETKAYTVNGSGAVGDMGIVLSTGEYVVMSVASASGEALSSERTVVCTELIIPVRSYTAETAAGIKNGVLALENLSEKGEAEAASFNAESVALASESDDTVFWKASENVTTGQTVLDSSTNGVCTLTATYDMNYTKANYTIDNIAFNGYVAHGSVNGYLASTGKDRSGFTFIANSDGVLTAYCQNVGANKDFVIIEDSAATESEALASSIEEGKSGNCSITAAVKANTTYYIGVLGSKGRFGGISFTAGAPVVSVLAKAGETVQITATPNDGCKTESVSAAAADGSAVEVVSNEDKTVSTFVMPESDVLISASFVKDGTSPEPYDGVIGDVDGNGILTANDPAALLTFLLSGETKNGWVTDISCADVSNNGSLGAEDAAMILAKVLNGSYQFDRKS